MSREMEGRERGREGEREGGREGGRERERESDNMIMKWENRRRVGKIKGTLFEQRK